MALIIEVIHQRTGEVRQRLRLERFPASVGRQLDNDLVLDDPYVDAHHAQFVLDPDGSLVLEDRGSVNRLSTTFHQGAERVRCAPGAEVFVGRTRLRVRDETAPVAAALALHGASDADSSRTWYERTPVRAASIVLATGLFGLTTWISTAERNAPTMALGGAVAFAVFALMRAGIWAVAGRVVVGQARFVAHMAIASWMCLIALVSGVFSEWLNFLAPDNGIADATTGIIVLVASGLTVALHLGEASFMSRARRLRAGAIVCGVVILIAGAFTLADEDAFTTTAEFSGVIKSAPVSIVPKKTLAEFDTVILDLRADVDSLLAKPVKAAQPE